MKNHDQNVTDQFGRKIMVSFLNQRNIRIKKIGSVRRALAEPDVVKIVNVIVSYRILNSNFMLRISAMAAIIATPIINQVLQVQNTKSFSNVRNWCSFLSLTTLWAKEWKATWSSFVIFARCSKSNCMPWSPCIACKYSACKIVNCGKKIFKVSSIFQKYRLAVILRRISVTKPNYHGGELGYVLLTYGNCCNDAEPDSYQLLHYN